MKQNNQVFHTVSEKKSLSEIESLMNKLNRLTGYESEKRPKPRVIAAHKGESEDEGDIDFFKPFTHQLTNSIASGLYGNNNASNRTMRGELSSNQLMTSMMTLITRAMRRNS